MGEGGAGTDAGDRLSGPRLSVVTASYNHGPYLAERLRSIQTQTYSAFEWIIVDDASTDGSAELLQGAAAADRRIRLVLKTRNAGVAATTAAALELASGEYVYRAESDDTCAPGLLGTLVALLDRYPAAAIAFARTVELRARTQWYSDWPLRDSGFISARPFLELLAKGNFVPGPTTMCRRRALVAAGGFGSPVCRVACDWHTWLRLARHHGAAWTSEVLGGHRWHEQNLSRESLELLEERYRIVEDIFADPDDDWLGTTALRSISYRAGAGALVRARLRRDTEEAVRVIAAIDDADPGARRRPRWFYACARATAGASRQRLRRPSATDRLPWEMTL